MKAASAASKAPMTPGRLAWARAGRGSERGGERCEGGGVRQRASVDHGACGSLRYAMGADGDGGSDGAICGR